MLSSLLLLLGTWHIFDTENEVTALFRNAGEFLPDCTASISRRGRLNVTMDRRNVEEAMRNRIAHLGFVVLTAVTVKKDVT